MEAIAVESQLTVLVDEKTVAHSVPTLWPTAAFAGKSPTHKRG
jgi:hypothetical protein